MRFGKPRKEKDELWAKDKSFVQRKWIDFKLWYMQYMRKTHGMGFLLFLMIGFIMFMVIDRVVLQRMTAEDNPETKRIEKLAICLIKGACIWNV